MSSVKKREVIGGVLFFLFAATYFVMALDIKQYDDGFLSSDFVPKVYGVILMMLSALQVLIGVWNNKVPEEQDGVAATVFIPGQLVSVALTFVLLLGYILLLKPVGFIIMSSVFIFLMTLMLYPKTERHARRLAQVAAVACLFSASVYFLFVKGFALTLPAGILG